MVLSSFSYCEFSTLRQYHMILARFSSQSCPTPHPPSHVPDGFQFLTHVVRCCPAAPPFWPSLVPTMLLLAKYLIKSKKSTIGAFLFSVHHHQLLSVERCNIVIHIGVRG